MSLCLVLALVSHWLLPNKLGWEAAELGLLAVWCVIWGRTFVLRTREHRVAGLPTDARTVLRASIAVEGLVLMLVIVIVVLVATVVL